MVQEVHSLTLWAVSRAGRLLLAAVLLSACGARATHEPPHAPLPPTGSPPSMPAPATPGGAPPAPPRPPPPPREIRLSSATRALVTQARAQSAQGDLPAASLTLDRALRIEPSNALLWIELGRLRLEENDPHQAETCGRKALALASGDPGAQAKSGRLLADALRAQRRNPEAREIESRPFMNRAAPTTTTSP